MSELACSFRLLGAGRFAVRFALILVAVAFCGTADAQKETRKDLVTIKSIKAEKKKEGWVIVAQGDAPGLPKGTKVNFHLTWLGQSVAVFKEEVSGKFKVTLAPKNVPITQDKFFLKTIIQLDDQSRKIQKQIEADTKTFHPGGHPWTSHFFDKGFMLATAEEIEAERKAIKEYFQSRYKELATLDGTVKKNAKDAKEGTEFEKSGDFDAKEWRKWFDKDVVDRIKAVQKEIQEKHQESRFLPYRRTLFLLTEVSAGVARRSLKRQKELYEEKGVKLAEAEDKPEELDIDSVRRRRVSDRYLNELIQEINAQLKPQKKKTDKPAEAGKKGKE